ncbi:MAG: class I SAM-dependent methyltransferase [Rhodothermales bacterium]
MSERTSGLYRLITHPKFYSDFQDILGANQSRQRIKDLYFPDLTGQAVLEVGCGPATGVPFMKSCESYLGLDWNATHIGAARSLFPDPKYQFEVANVADPNAMAGRTFDRAFAFGLLHHLDDAEAISLLSGIARVLRPNGTLLVGEPIFHQNQHPFARFMKHCDSGRNIRTREGYMDLFETCLVHTEFRLHTDLLRVPYSHGFFLSSGKKDVA